MTGKEALNLLFCTSEGLPENKVYECKKILEKELDELTKYKRVFEILKNNCHISNYVVDGVNSGKKITFDVIREWYDKEEYELLKELINDESR